MQDAVIIDCVRTAAGRAPDGALCNWRPEETAAAVIRALLARYPQVPADEIDDIVLGCAAPEAGSNVARIAGLRGGLPDMVPGVMVNRLCASGLQAIAIAADRIRAGGAHILLAGGTESMSLPPWDETRNSPNPWLVENMPQAYITMGLTAENLRRRFGISREEQDVFALESHRKAVSAQGAGKFGDEIIPLVLPGGGEEFRTDEGPRADCTLEGLAAMPAIFLEGGSVTAGNSAKNSDGAAIALVMSAGRAAALGLKPKARLAGFAVCGVPPEIMGMGPVVAIPKALALAGVAPREIGLIELNEAFAVQALVVVRKAALDAERVNVNGGAIALGHAAGATGARLAATLLREMERRNVRYGLVTMSVGGGQGAAGILERL
jgi:acetyl-CoA acyltransferase